jgi:hypothetical protein
MLITLSLFVDHYKSIAISDDDKNITIILLVDKIKEKENNLLRIMANNFSAYEKNERK